MFIKHKIITAVFLLFALAGLAQPASYNFRHFTASDGLGDGIIRSIAQDGYGFMWFGTVNGLTVYNGYSTKVTEAGAAGAFVLTENVVTSLCRDKHNRMWLTQTSGLYLYEEVTGRFIIQPGTTDLATVKLYTPGDDFLYMGTKKGLKIFNTATKKLLAPSTDAPSIRYLNLPINDIGSNGNNILYLATDTGVVIYNTAEKKATLLVTQPAMAKGLTQIAIDKKGRLWCTDGIVLYQVDKNNFVTVYPQLTGPKKFVADRQINDLLVDSKGRLWVAASRTGLCFYNEPENNFTAFKNDPLQTQSLSTNIVSSLFQSADGTIWIGSEGYGLNYFNPDKSFFYSLLPSFHQSPALPDNWCRHVAEDKAGRWWLATAKGVAVYNPKEDSYKIFQNKEEGKKELHANSVRSVLCASDGTVWIGTSDGLNRYHPQSGKMDFIGEKDSLPLSFFWHLAEDKQHKIWIACRNGIYTYDPLTNRFDDNHTNRLLEPYCRFRTRTIFIDSRNRTWFGLDGKGLLLYDETAGTVKHWIKKDGDSTSLTNDLVTSITEDKQGTIWVSTLSGLNAYNENTNSFKQYFKAAGLPSNRISSLKADDADRLWMGTSKGLCMLDKSRRYFKSFGLEDGLASIEFNDQSACIMSNGLFVFPTFKGFLYFNPATYHLDKDSLLSYLTAFRVYNKDFPLRTNSEAVKDIDLKWDQAFFSFTVAAPDYAQAAQTFYAYWLEPFDKGWIYTKERTRNYTNVPGGHYTLHFKATTDIQNWNTPETKIVITIGTVFYKTWWFTALMIALFLLLFYNVYRYRLRQQQQVMALQSKATVLEKEKTVAQYESLKQQLNPHFLFNSLSSLSGLIQKDQSAAKIFLDQLSKIYRYILKSGDSETVRISEDLKLAQTYLQLQQTRFGEGLQLKVNIDEEFLSRRIAPVTIQNLIENAIKHNIIDKEVPLVISITTDENNLIVQNNLQKKSFVEGSNKQGLQNMKTLYRYLCGQQITTDETAEYFTVKVPFV